LEVSAIGLGCGTMTPFYDAPDPQSGIATIRRARELGIDFLDTSDAYGVGRNEELIARAVNGHRRDYVIERADRGHGRRDGGAGAGRESTRARYL
jgi:aryl-alcohol dehydrogenase-like predicted oxidoreductase